jgi:hypothetical protein
MNAGYAASRTLFALLLIAPCPGSELRFDDPAALEDFLLASTDQGVKRSLEAVLKIEGAGNMISLAVRMGPAYAAKVAAMLPDPGFREGYQELAKYLDLFGPCQKKQAPSVEGWWSNYPDPPSANHCSEATKLLFGALLWNQVHYCARLASGDEKPKAPVPSGRQPPYRLDEPPVQTHWLNAEKLYAVGDAALRWRFGATLRRRAAETADNDDKVRAAMILAADELGKENASREQTALALAKLLIRRYQRTHLDHLARPPVAEASAEPD